MKMIFDLTLVAIACALSLYYHGKIVGVREGTVAAAFLVGQISKRITATLKEDNFEERVFKKTAETQ